MYTKLDTYMLEKNNRIKIRSWIMCDYKCK